MHRLFTTLIIGLALLCAGACEVPPPGLHSAVVDQDLARVTRLLEQGADADRRWRYTQAGHSGATFELSPLELAVVRPSQDIVRALANQADIYATNANGMTPLEWAIRFGSPGNARLLWELSDKTTYRKHAANALRLAREDPETFRWLLAEVATEESVGELFAYWAAWGADGKDFGLRYVEELLAQGLKPSQESLAAAVRGRNLAITRALLDTGLDIDGGAEDYPPLHDALSRGRDLSVAEYLLERGADPNRLDRWGRTPAMNVVRVHSVLPNRTTEQLRDALARNILEPLALLVAYGADLTLTDPQGRTVADYLDATRDPDHAHSRAELERLMAAGGPA